jgi:antitoxin MazE
MKVLVKKWGNSASVRIPAAVMQAANLRLDAAVDVRVKDGCVVLEPVHDQPCDLDTLLAGITAENLHAELSFGKATGKESL